ncbi:hypothetical protein NQ317_012473 [Molorchus minor]|uniref:Gustatory receptor n=1 Tax=Molorchus minor TaxID=1323400 RepID=A0ABQ9JC26_9CUCU|nr:hypothetical protein NQ317_012473 [Molorchus minor]
MNILLHLCGEVFLDTVRDEVLLMMKLIKGGRSLMGIDGEILRCKVITNVFGLYEKYTLFYANMPLSVALLEAAFNIFVFISNIMASFDFIFFRNKRLVDINVTCNRLEKICHIYFKDALKHNRQQMMWVFISTTFLGVSCASLTITYFALFIGVLCRAYFGMSFDILQMGTLALKLYTDLAGTRDLLKALNKSLKYCLYPKFSTMVGQKTRLEEDRAKILIRTYSELFDVLENMNSVYGFHFLTIILNLFYIFCNFALKLIVSSRPATFFTLLTTGSIIVACTAFGILIMMICDSVTHQVRQTIDISYHMLIKQADYLGTKENMAIRNSLVLFAERLHSTSFRFSAAGQFPVDHGTIFMVLGSIAMYLLIIPIKA